MHHGLLITGARGGGKTTAATHIAQALLCTSESAGDACGVCVECRAIESANHPDVHWVRVAEDKEDISIEQVRGLQETLGRMPMQGRARVVVFDPVDRLNERGQNALLKTLEEPGSDTFLLLLSSRPERLLGTVRSRTDRLGVTPLPPEVIREELQTRVGGDSSVLDWAARTCGGSLGLAVELLEGGLAEFHQHLVGFLGRPTDISAIELSRLLIAGVDDRKSMERRVQTLLCVLRGMLRESMHGALAHTSDPTYLADAYDSWATTFERVFEAESELDLRIAPEQVLSHLLFGLQEDLSRRTSSAGAAG